MWTLYEQLLEPISSKEIVAEYIAGSNYTMVITESGNAGIVKTVFDQRRPRQYFPEKGMPLLTLAKAIFSWNFMDASFGLAAIHAWYNGKDRFDPSLFTTSPLTPIAKLRRLYKDHSVLLVGNQWSLEENLSSICHLSVLGEPETKNHYPETAAEYLIPGSDFVLFDDTSLITKWAIRLFSLCQHYSIPCFPYGYGIPFSPLLFSYGAKELMGSSVCNIELCKHLILAGATEEAFTECCKTYYMEMQKRGNL